MLTILLILIGAKIALLALWIVVVTNDRQRKLNAPDLVARWKAAAAIPNEQIRHG